MGDQPDLFSTVPCPTCRGSGLLTHEELRGRIEDLPGAVGRDHPETSRRAASLDAPRFGTQRHRVLAALVPGPATAAEVASSTGLSRNQTATRLGELRQGGFVAYLRTPGGTPVERRTGPRDTGLVQMLTGLGRSALAALSESRR